MTETLGWALVHFLWQGALIALLLQGTLAACRTAAARYRWLMAALVAMLAAPVATYIVLSRPAMHLPPVETAVLAPAAAAVHVAPATLHLSISWLVYLWLAGVAGLSLRWLGGWVLLERLRREAEPLSHELAARCRQLARHIGLKQKVEFAQSALAAVPVVVGWLRPIVLVPLSTLTSLTPSQLDSVILHELAHVRRLDAFANLFQILIETLLFYHPAVWWVSHRMRIEREHCCDDIAVAIAGDSFGYAMALTLIESERALPQMAMAATGGALKNRVKRLLGQEAAPSRPFYMAPLAVALIGLMLGACTYNAVAATPAESAASSADRGGSYIGSMAAAGYNDLSANQLIAMKSVGVTGEEAAAWRAAGFTVSPSQLVTLHSMGVRPADAAGFRDAGLGVLGPNDLSTLHSVGVTPDYVRQMRDAGFNSTNSRDFVTARSVGVTPDYVAKLRKGGASNLDPNRIVTLKASGID